MSTSSSRSSLSSGEHKGEEEDKETGEGIMKLEDAENLILPPAQPPPPPSSLHPLTLKTDPLVSISFMLFGHRG